MAVSKPMFASNYSLESSKRNLSDLHASFGTKHSFALLESNLETTKHLQRQKFSKLSARIFVIWGVAAQDVCRKSEKVNGKGAKSTQRQENYAQLG